MNIRQFPGWAAVIASSFGIFLHAYISFFKADSGPNAFTIGLLAWASTPYILCLLISFLGKGRPLLGFCSATLAFAGDASIYYAVFVAPTSSTAAIGLLFSPLVGLVLWVPLGVLIGYLLSRWFGRPGAA